VSSAEIYDPTGNGSSNLTTDLSGNSLTYPRYGHTATLVQDSGGSYFVLIMGGFSFAQAQVPNAELYDPLTHTFSFLVTTSANIPANFGFLGHTATLLRDGRVLLVGGILEPHYKRAPFLE